MFLSQASTKLFSIDIFIEWMPFREYSFRREFNFVIDMCGFECFISNNFVFKPDQIT